MTIREREEQIMQFIRRHIDVCQTSLVEAALQAHIFTIEDIENLYRPFDGQLLHPNTCVRCSAQSSCLDSETGECRECFEKEQLPRDIYEWWAVSGWFVRKLQEAGEPILSNGYGTWWGRCTAGQSIAMDEVIQTIADAVLEA